MTRLVMSGSGFTTPRAILSDASLEMKEARILQRIKFYRSTPAAEGAATGYGGILLGIADREDAFKNKKNIKRVFI